MSCEGLSPRSQASRPPTHRRQVLLAIRHGNWQQCRRRGPSVDRVLHRPARRTRQPLGRSMRASNSSVRLAAEPCRPANRHTCSADRHRMVGPRLRSVEPEPPSHGLVLPAALRIGGIGVRSERCRWRRCALSASGSHGRSGCRSIPAPGARSRRQSRPEWRNRRGQGIPSGLPRNARCAVVRLIREVFNVARSGQDRRPHRRLPP